MKRLFYILIAFSTLLMAACQGAGFAMAPSATQPAVREEPFPQATLPPAESDINGNDMPDRDIRTPTKLPERVPPTEIVSPVTGEVPAEILESILKDLSAQTGVNAADIVVYRAQAMQWSDGSLGCPQPGMFYTQATVSGYWVILQIGEQQYDYHANDRGYFFLCEGVRRPDPPATPNS